MGVFGPVTEGQQLCVDKLQPPLQPCPVRRKRVNVFVKYNTEQPQKARSRRGRSESGSLAPSPSLAGFSPLTGAGAGVVPSHLSPVVFCSLSAVTSVPPRLIPDSLRCYRYV